MLIDEGLQTALKAAWNSSARVELQEGLPQPETVASRCHLSRRNINSCITHNDLNLQV